MSRISFPITLASLSVGLLLGVPVPAAAQGAPVDDGIPCATAQSPPEIPTLISDEEFRAARRAFPRAGGFDIVIVPGPTLAANAPALAAFERAAEQWEALFTDPITVTIDADLADLGAGGPIGSTGAVLLLVSYTSMRAALVDDAADESDDDIVSSLPLVVDLDALMTDSFLLDDTILFSKANGKALGYADLDDAYGASDGSITYNTQYAGVFDYDSSNGIAPGDFDFETIASHEIGHLLGFTSTVQIADSLKNIGTTSGDLPLSTLDLFRFHNATVDDPASEADFSTFPRSLTYDTADVTDDLDDEWRMSTGRYFGDGRQASHWRDNSLSGVRLGVMDPTYSSPEVWPIATSDRRALDLIGYDFDLCGNNVVDAGETCDDGNRLDGDCCSSSCLTDPNGTACDDGTFCNGADTCNAGACTVHPGDPCSAGGECNDFCDETADTCADAAGTPCSADAYACTQDVCDGAGTCGIPDDSACSDSDPCTADACEVGTGCVNVVAPTDDALCLVSPKAKLQVVLGAEPAKNKLVWQWIKGHAFDQAELGVPTVDTTYTLCVYDMTASVPSLVTSVVIPPSDTLWTDLDPKGLKYSDKTAASDGVRVVQLKTGEVNKTKVKLIASGEFAPIPVPAGATFFVQDPWVVAQLHNSDGTCWRSRFFVSQTKKNDAFQFKAIDK